MSIKYQRIQLRMINSVAVFCFILIAIVWCAHLRAGDNNLLLKGTLVVPPSCSLNGGNTLYVRFGDNIGINKVPAGIYREVVDPGLECDETNLAWNLVLTVTGIPAAFDSENATVVSADQENLGVKLYVNSAPFVLDTPLKVNGQTMPLIEAVLVQREGAELDDGDFTARATLRAEFQ